MGNWSSAATALPGEDDAGDDQKKDFGEDADEVLDKVGSQSAGDGTMLTSSRLAC